MSYATIVRTGPVHLCRVTPLDTRVVRLKLSVKIPGYHDTFFDTELNTLASLITTGTKTRSKEALETYQKRYGISLSVANDAGLLHLHVAVLQQHAQAAVALLTDILFNATLPPHEYTVRMQTMREMNREARDDAKRIVEINFRNTLYPIDSQYHEETLDEERARIDTLKRTHVVKIYEALKTGEWFCTYVGNPEMEKTLSPLLNRLARTATVVDRPFQHTHAVPTTKTFTTVPGKTNVEVRIGNILPITTTDDDYQAFTMGLTVLGKVGGFMGRLMSIVREKEGLTYGIYARTSNESFETTGHWYIFTFFTAKDLKKGLASTIRELKRLIVDGITDDELRRFKEILQNQFLIAHGSSAARLGLYHSALLNHETPAMLHDELTRMQSLTRTEVNTALKKFIKPNQLVIAGAGPVDALGNGII